MSSKCAPNQALPDKGIKPYKEQNGMKNSDGLLLFAYSFDKTNWGTFTVGTWFYNTFHKSYSNTVVDPANPTRPRQSRMAWQEYYIFWKLPILKSG